MSTLATTLSPTDAGRAEILARHLFDEERMAENADLDLEQYIQKLDGLHEGEGCLLNPATLAEWHSLARVHDDRNVGTDN